MDNVCLSSWTGCVRAYLLFHVQFWITFLPTDEVVGSRWKGMPEDAIFRPTHNTFAILRHLNSVSALFPALWQHFISSSINTQTSNEIYIVRKMSVCSWKGMPWRLVAPRKRSSNLNLVARNFGNFEGEWTPAVYGFEIGLTTNSASVKTVFACHQGTCHVQPKGTAIKKLQKYSVERWRVPVEAVNFKMTPGERLGQEIWMK